MIAILNLQLRYGFTDPCKSNSFDWTVVNDFQKRAEEEVKLGQHGRV